MESAAFPEDSNPLRSKLTLGILFIEYGELRKKPDHFTDQAFYFMRPKIRR
jgi:hypothetical protein